MSASNSTKTPIWPSALALVASILGFAFALSSTLDYTSHLDRQLHDLHCSFIPGLSADAAKEGACRAAMYSPYSALFKDKYWGGIPIAIFAVGAFGFFLAFSLYLLLARNNAPRRAQQFLFGVSLTPLAVSVLMFVISLTKLGTFCKTCVGIYVSSALLAVAGVGALLGDMRRAKAALDAFQGKSAPPTMKSAAALEDTEKDGVAPTIVEGEVPPVEAPAKEPPKKEADPIPPPRTGGPALIPAWLIALAIFSIVPAALYVSAMPRYDTYVTGCGKLEKPTEPANTLLHIQPAGAKQQATMFVDPFCPTCKAFHQRLVTEGIFDKLDTTLVLFPLDNECNWMLDRAVHPGSCTVAKAILCGGDQKALAILEWAYDNQEGLLESAKGAGGIPELRTKIRERFPGLDQCIDSKETKQRLDRTLRYVVANQLPVATPQFFLDGTRLCDEDSDIGLSYTLSKLAPDLMRSR
ncbi:MAG: vitamin K epoxide reductase family protein [Polyangiaceae bacterium]